MVSMGDISNLGSDAFVQMIETNNALLYRINEQNDLLLALLVCILICTICYAILKAFSRF